MVAIRTSKNVYWVTTGVIFLFEGVMPALTSHTDLAVEGIRHLGYPSYFGPMLTVFKVVGAFVLILPIIRGRMKEWAYAGFAITTISAFISHWAVDGLGGQTLFPLFILAILLISYSFYHKLAKQSTHPSKHNSYVVSSLHQQY